MASVLDANTETTDFASHNWAPNSSFYGHLQIGTLLKKINEMNDEVFNELVAYSYLAGLATAQLQKDEGEDLPAEVDLNDTQFIERSLL